MQANRGICSNLQFISAQANYSMQRLAVTDLQKRYPYIRIITLNYN